MHQTNGGFVYIGLNADCSRKVSKRQHKLVYFLLHQSRHNYDIFDGIMEMNLTRGKVEIVIRFITPFQTNHPRARSVTGSNQLR